MLSTRDKFLIQTYKYIESKKDEKRHTVQRAIGKELGSNMK